LFDAGFGDLFVVRVAGNIVAPSVIGSIEFAASQFG
jgi:carbonic anhydrase